MGSALQLISKARTALEAANTVEDALDVADKAAAVQEYLKRSAESLIVQNQAAEIKVRAERKAGELLAKMPKASPPGKKISDSVSHISKATKLSEINLTRKQSQRYEDMAAVPQRQFEKLASAIDATAEGREITSTEIRNAGASIKRAKKQSRRQSVIINEAPGIVSDLSSLAGHRFGTIYADPPWRYGNQGTRAATDNHYGTMTVDELCEMPVGELANDDAHLHLWTTNAFLPESFRLIEAWGFEYRSLFFWAKTQMGIGNYWRVSHEILLLGIRGNAKSFAAKNLKSWAEFPRGKHSAKPEEIRLMIEAASAGPYLELFGRKSITGWTVFGNQVERMLV